MDKDQTEKDARKLKLQLRRLVRDLGKRRARHTELITVYVPSGYGIQGVIDQIASEAGTARNIKSAQTRKNVTGALEKMLQHLRSYKKTPPHGLAVFCGNVAEREGAEDFQLWSIEPSEEIRVKLYKCDQTFFLEPLTEQLEAKSTFGLLVMDRKEASFALLKGKQIVPLLRMDSMVPGKFKVGGQSAARMARVIEGMAKDFYKKVGDVANQKFSEKEVKGVLIGGPGPTKEDFAKGDFLQTGVKNKVLAVKNIGYTNEYGLKELLERSEDVLEKEELMQETRIVQRFLTILATRKQFAAIGEENVRKAIDARAVEILLLSDGFDESKTDEMMDLAEGFGADVYIISRDTREGQQLAGLGGVAAILRFAVA